MVWFKYFKSNDTINLATPNFRYPYVKKFLNRFIPKDYLNIGTWVSIPLGEIKPSHYLSTSLVDIVDQSSYLVVYEPSQEVESYSPVKSFIDENNVLYFQTAQWHPSGSVIDGNYALYYHTPNLRYVKPIGQFLGEDGESFDSPTLFQVTSELDAANYFSATESEIQDLTFEVTLDSVTSYNFSFLNSDANWNQGSTTYPGSRLYISFSGPEIRIFGSKGPDYGKCKVTITALESDDGSPAKVSESDIVIDCYSATEQNNVLLFSRGSDDLEYRDYVIDIIVLSEKNILSTGNKFKVSSYKFNYNVYSYLLGEQLSDKISLVSTGMFRGA